MSALFDPSIYLELVDVDGKFIVVGAPPDPLSVNLGGLIHSRRTFAGSLIGGIRETQEMLDFCGKFVLPNG